MKILHTIFLAQLTACSPILDSSDSASIEDLVYEPGFIETEDCGFADGEKACDFILLDSEDEMWRLSDYKGEVLLLDLSAMWCGPCQAAGQTTQETQDHYQGSGFQYVTLLIADLANDSVEAEDLKVWTESFGITSAPVLAGDRSLLVSGGSLNGFPVESWPTFILVDREGKVLTTLRGFNEAMIRQAIEQAI
jgi:thiol-disulfide isomerase/thioredoxin